MGARASTLKGLLWGIRVELDAIQIFVELIEKPDGIAVKASCLADRLLAEREIRRAGLPVVRLIE